jgi:hypothetical protein
VSPVKRALMMFLMMFAIGLLIGTVCKLALGCATAAPVPDQPPTVTPDPKLDAALPVSAPDPRFADCQATLDGLETAAVQPCVDAAADCAAALACVGAQ